MPRRSAVCATVTNALRFSLWRTRRECGILLLAPSRQGALPSSLWSFPNSAKSHRDCRRSPRRGQNRRTRTATGYSAAKGQWPRPGVVTRRSLSSRQGSRIGVIKETADETRWKGNAQGQERAPFRRRRQFAKADSCCSETGPSSETARTGDQRRKGQTKTAGQTETGSRSP